MSSRPKTRALVRRNRPDTATTPAASPAYFNLLWFDNGTPFSKSTRNTQALPPVSKVPRFKHLFAATAPLPNRKQMQADNAIAPVSTSTLTPPGFSRPSFYQDNNEVLAAAVPLIESASKSPDFCSNSISWNDTSMSLLTGIDKKSILARKKLFLQFDKDTTVGKKGVISLGEVDRGLREMGMNSIAKPVISRAFNFAKTWNGEDNENDNAYAIDNENELRVFLQYLRKYDDLAQAHCRAHPGLMHDIPKKDFAMVLKQPELVKWKLGDQDYDAVFRELDKSNVGQVPFGDVADWAINLYLILFEKEDDDLKVRRLQALARGRQARKRVANLKQDKEKAILHKSR